VDQIIVAVIASRIGFGKPAITTPLCNPPFDVFLTRMNRGASCPDTYCRPARCSSAASREAISASTRSHCLRSSSRSFSRVASSERKSRRWFPGATPVISPATASLSPAW